MNIDFFKNRVTQFLKQEAFFSKRYYAISIIRITTFLLAVTAIIYFADMKNGTAISIVTTLFIISFGVLIKWHNKIKYARNHAQFLSQINQDEIHRINGNVSEFEGGEKFLPKGHFYAADLDVFGRNSLFQLTNRTATITGQRKLAKWLLFPAQKPEIEARQQATLELKSDVDFCQNFQATGMHYLDREATFVPLEDWLKSSSVVSSNRKLKLLSFIMPLLFVILLIGVITWSYHITFLLIPVVVNAIILKNIFKYSLDITEKTSKSVSTLQSISSLLKLMERKQFQTGKLQDLQKNISINNVTASSQIRKLAKLLDLLNGRSNMLYSIFNLVFLIDLHLVVAAEKWKLKQGRSVQLWFESISEFDVLASFARMAHANPQFFFPRVVNGQQRLEAIGISHPLIKSSERVSNNFGFSNDENVLIVTGSNMSGKSTFLRTIGINVVLALSGAPVCAEKMKLSVQQVFTSMRTQDNLEEHISSFYAELRKIKQFLQLLDTSDMPVLFMLDEILKGTNSLDRHKGAVGLVKQLENKDAVGFISTHDLELGKTAASLSYCKNFSFNSTVMENEIVFDYKILDGVCRSFNASALMKKIGIQIDD